MSTDIQIILKTESIFVFTLMAKRGPCILSLEMYLAYQQLEQYIKEYLSQITGC